MPTLTITPQYTEGTPMPDKWVFEINGAPTDPDIAKALKRLGYRLSGQAWWKIRYGQGCNKASRDLEQAKLKRLIHGLTTERKT